MSEEPVQLSIDAGKPGGIINRNIYGNFAEHLGRCIYEGIWVGEDSPIPNTRGIRNDVVAALREITIPVLRWPGGCFADEYHWKDGIGPRANRPSMINTHWGGVVENNHFGTHEFLDLCEQLDTEPYISGNVGSGTPQEMMEWVEYITSDADSPMPNLRRKNGREKPWNLKYFGVGNESWGCGGNMRPEYYADLYRRYNTFVKNYSGNRVERLACGASVDDYRWTEVMMERVGQRMNGLSLHHYTIPTRKWDRKGSSLEFGELEWHTGLSEALRMDELVTRHSAIMDKIDPEKKIGLIVDEWGTWHDAEPGTEPGFLYQQNTLRDALVAGISLNVFNHHCDRVAMANIAQTINVLQAVILTDKEKMLLTPTYHVFDMYKGHMNATLLPVTLSAPDYQFGERAIPSIHVSASRNETGRILLSAVNTKPHDAARAALKIAGASAKKVSGRVLTAEAMNAHNTFDQPDALKPAPFTAFEIRNDEIEFTLPAKSVVVLEIQ